MAKKRKTQTPSHGILPGQWFALLSDPASRPHIFGSKREANSHRMGDEYIVPVYVHAVSLKDVTKARRWEMAQAKSGRKPRKHAGIKIDGASLLSEALRKAIPIMRQKVSEELTRQANSLAGKRGRLR